MKKKKPITIKRVAKKIAKPFRKATEKSRSFIRGIQISLGNLIIWFPTIWGDRYWDHYFLFLIIRKKLSLMETHIRKNGIHEEAEKDADNMLICVKALTRLIEDNYHEVAFENHNKKWGDLDMTFEDIPEGKKFGELKFNRKNAITEEQLAEEREESKQRFEDSVKMQSDDLDLLFNTMRKEVLRWWD